MATLHQKLTKIKPLFFMNNLNNKKSRLFRRLVHFGGGVCAKWEPKVEKRLALSIILWLNGIIDNFNKEVYYGFGFYIIDRGTDFWK